MEIINTNIIKEKAQIIITCTSLSHEGLGIGKVDGIKDGIMVNNFPIFTTNFLIGEKAKVEITSLKKTYGYGKIIKIFTDTISKDRINPACKNYGKCGGCNLMHLNYLATLNFKTQMVKETLKKIANLDNVIVNPTIEMDNPNYYRNKVQVPFRNESNKIICGFFARNSHQVIALDECLIQPKISTDIVKFIKNILNEYKILGYNEFSDQGLVKHVLVRTNHDLTKIMVILVLKENNLPYQEEIINKLIKRYPVISSIIINVKPENSNTILGKNCQTIYGDDYIEDILLGLKFRISALSFYQVNHSQTEKLYQKVIELASLNKEDILIDAYCGIGTIGLIASKYVKEVYAVEIVKDAILNAKTNALINNINNIHFVCAKAEEQIVKWYETNILANIIIVDPPRKGCDKTLLDTIIKMKIAKVIYVSCEVASLSRDLKYLTQNNYQIITIQPVDMFAYTSNIENIVYLSYK